MTLGNKIKLCIKSVNIKTVATRIVATVLALLTISGFILDYMTYSKATAFSNLGTKQALGSPVLNTAAVADDWNKYETAVWGIYLSNFCIPFVDDYESAFNLSSGNGSKGRGLQAINFGTGSDIASNKVLQELTTYAINMQTAGLRRIYVSYNNITIEDNGDITYNTKSSFNTGSSNTTDNNTGGTDTDDNNTETPADTSTTDTSRTATLKDLFFSFNKTDGFLGIGNGAVADENSTWVSNNPGASSKEVKFDRDSAQNDKTFRTFGSGNFPVFAIQTSNANWQVVCDYLDSWDIEMFVCSLASGLYSDCNDKVSSFLEENIDKLENYPLYLDSYGNICFADADRYIVVIPASSNQYLKKQKSINFLTSAIFNAGTQFQADQLLYSAAGTQWSDLGKKGWFLIDGDSPWVLHGLPALASSDKSISQTGSIIFYDTDLLDWTNKDNQAYTAGDKALDLFKSDINSDTCKTGIKVEPVLDGSLFGSFKGGDKDKFSTGDGKAVNSLMLTYFVSSNISNIFNYTASREKLSYVVNTSSGDEIALFNNSGRGDSVVIPVDLQSGLSSRSSKNWAAVYRKLVNNIYSLYMNSNQTGKQAIAQALSNEQKYFYTVYTSGEYLNETAADFLKLSPDLYRSSISSDEDADLKKAKVSTEDHLMAEFLIGAASASVSKSYTANFVKGNDSISLYGDNAEAAKERLIKAYTASDVYTSASNMLGLRNGTAFSTFASSIYLTYINWYGLRFDKLSGKMVSDFNDSIIQENVLIDDITKVASIASREDKENKILEYTYLMLDPVAGKDYRNSVMMTNFGSWMWTEYNRLVYGGADTYYYSTVATNNNTGFLTVDNYSENFMTSWFMSNYITISIYFIIGGIILVIMAGLLLRRKFSWFILASAAIVSVVLLLPSVGEIVPYAADNIVNNIFEDKMTYWSIAELAGNASTEEAIVDDKNDSSGQLSQADIQNIAYLVSAGKATYLDRYLSLKQDISNKVTSSNNIDYESLQSMKSTRWLLPMIIKQYTNVDATPKYVYVPLGDKLDDVSNMYWYYNPTAAKEVKSISTNTNTATETVNQFESASEVYTSYSKFIDIAHSESLGDIRDIAYKDDIMSRSKSYEYDELPVHTYSYIINQLYDANNPVSSRQEQSAVSGNIFQAYSTDLFVIDYSTRDVPIEDYSSYDEWAKAYAEYIKQNPDTDRYMRTALRDLQSSAGNYDRYDRSTVTAGFSYLWSTESPLPYFHGVVKDSFDANPTLARVTYDIIGDYKTDADGNERRINSILFDDDVYYTRDVADLECLFRNTLPYMYSVQLAAGGYSGTDGVFLDEKLDNYKLYKDNYASWLFLSNWVTKIYENSNYNGKATIGYIDSSGQRHKMEIENQLMPDCYMKADGTGRPMVFSEAQMIKMGLVEKDLSLVELKCIEVNKDIATKWTLLVNYVSTAGVTPDVMQRQMAIDATTIFCKEFSDFGIMNSEAELYPSSLDLRSISFDSVMCMLLLNSTNNVSYIYGDTMRVLVSESSIFTSILLLLTTALCTAVIPFVRNVALGLLFYLGFFSVLRSLLKPAKQKVETCLGYSACHVIYLSMIIVYMLGIKLLMAITTSDEMLTLSSTQVQTGNPVWSILIVNILSLAFIIGSLWMIWFIIRNSATMGWAAIKGAFEVVSSNISTGFEKLANKAAEASELGTTSSYESSAGSQSVAQADTRVGNGNSTRGNGSSDTQSTRVPETSSSGNSSVDDDDSCNFNSGSTYVDTDSSDIDQAISRGRESITGNFDSFSEANEFFEEAHGSTSDKKKSDKGYTEVTYSDGFKARISDDGAVIATRQPNDD